MARATVGELEDRVIKLEKVVDTAAYIRRQLEIQVGILAGALAKHLGVESIDSEAVIDVIRCVSSPENLTKGMICEPVFSLKGDK